MFLPHRNHPEADHWGRAVVALIDRDAEVLAGIEVAAAVGDTSLIDHFRHVAAYVV